MGVRSRHVEPGRSRAPVDSRTTARRRHVTRSRHPRKARSSTASSRTSPPASVLTRTEPHRQLHQLLTVGRERRHHRRRAGDEGGLVEVEYEVWVAAAVTEPDVEQGDSRCLRREVRSRAAGDAPRRLDGHDRRTEVVEIAGFDARARLDGDADGAGVLSQPINEGPPTRRRRSAPSAPASGGCAGSARRRTPPTSDQGHGRT